MPRRRRTALAEPLKNADDRARGDGEAVLEALDRACGGQRLGDRQVLRHQLAEDHRHAVASVSAIAERDARDRALGQPRGLQRAVDELGDRRLGQEADQQVRQRDADLRARELRREAGAARAGRRGRRASPASAARSTVARSTVTNENSAATKAPQATTRASASAIRSSSINARPSAGRRRGRAWYYCWGRRSSTIRRRIISGRVTPPITQFIYTTADSGTRGRRKIRPAHRRPSVRKDAGRDQ